jgi:hypothetical protein
MDHGVTSAASGSSVSLRAWYDGHRVDDAVLYDITAQTATSLSAAILTRQRAAANPVEAEHWAARGRLVTQQVNALDPGDRAGLIAQQQAWLDEMDALTRRAEPQPA